MSRPTKAGVLAGLFAQNLPDDDLLDFQKEVRALQAKLAQPLAQNAPPPAGAVTAEPIARETDLAQRVQERSHLNVQNVERLERSSEAGNTSPSGAASDPRQAIPGTAANLFPELRAVAQQLQSLLADTVGDYGWKLASYALLVIDGLVERAEFHRLLAETVAPASLDRRGKLLHGGMLHQLASLGEAKLRALRLWDEEKSWPRLHRFKRDLPTRLEELGVPGMNLEHQLQALGIRWCARDGASWQRRGKHYKPAKRPSSD